MWVAGVFSLRGLLGVLLRRKGTLLVPILLVPAIAVPLSYLVPERYMSTTTILIDRSGILNPLVRFETAVSIQEWDELGPLRKIVYSRPLIERVIEELDLEPPDTTRREHEWLIDDIRESIHILSLESESFKIGCSADNPETAQRLAETVSSFFIERTLEGARREANAAVEFIQTQLEEFGTDLEAAKSELKTFQLQHLDKIEQDRSIQADLSRYEKDILRTQMRLREALFKQALLQRRLDQQEPTVAGEPMVFEDTPYQRRYRALKLERARLLANREEDHPEVARVEREMESILQLLEEERRDGLANQKRGVLSPVMQQTRAKLQEAEIEVATLNQELSDYEKQVQSLRSQREQIPEIQNRYDQLRARVNMLQDTYDSLDTKLQQAKISRAVELQQQENRFAIIDPPLVPLSRYTPIRSVFAIVGVIAGFMLGFALVVCLEIVDPRLCRLDELEMATPLPLWGAFPALHKPAEANPALRRLGVDRLVRWWRGVMGPQSVYLPAEEIEPAEFALHVSAAPGPSQLPAPVLASAQQALYATEQIAEQIRCLYRQREKKSLTVAVTSPRRGDGRTTLAANVSALLASEYGLDVLLVDADIVSPGLTRLLASPPDAEGLTHLAAGTHELTPTSEGDGLRLLAAGASVSSASTLAARNAVENAMEEVRQAAEVVVFDLPPILSYPQSRRLCQLCDVNILVARLYSTPKAATQAAARALPPEPIKATVANGHVVWIPKWLLHWM